MTAPPSATRSSAARRTPAAHGRATPLRRRRLRAARERGHAGRGTTVARHAVATLRPSAASSASASRRASRRASRPAHGLHLGDRRCTLVTGAGVSTDGFARAGSGRVQSPAAPRRDRLAAGPATSRRASRRRARGRAAPEPRRSDTAAVTIRPTVVPSDVPPSSPSRSYCGIRFLSTIRKPCVGRVFAPAHAGLVGLAVAHLPPLRGRPRLRRVACSGCWSGRLGRH